MIDSQHEYTMIHNLIIDQNKCNDNFVSLYSERRNSTNHILDQKMKLLIRNEQPSNRYIKHR